MPSIDAVIFDYGGVVCRLRRGATLQAISSLYNMSADQVREPFSLCFETLQRGDIGQGEFWDRLSMLLNKPRPTSKSNPLRRAFASGYEVNKNLISVINSLRLHGIKTAVLSNIVAAQAEFVRERSGFAHFDVTVLSYEVNMRKPEPSIYTHTANQLETAFQNCLFIDDKKENLVPAKRLGMQTILSTDETGLLNSLDGHFRYLADLDAQPLVPSEAVEA